MSAHPWVLMYRCALIAYLSSLWIYLLADGLADMDMEQNAGRPKRKVTGKRRIVTVGQEEARVAGTGMDRVVVCDFDSS